ncbi:hypothetical protein [Aliiglaciecola litoralis]|uniref:SMODS and SLOG-associating 2TM effector domain-containing protein n=1 Tax=Aliiglaciecola litoralis TaxID=582857 RepID=A0ABP3X5A6_9ALTE
MNSEGINAVLKRTKERSNLYRHLQLSWFVVHYAAGTSAIVAAALAAISDSTEVPLIIQQNTWLWGLLATVLTGVVTFLNPLQKARDYKKSYYEIYSGIQKYEANMIDIERLVAILEAAQERILKLNTE